MIKLLTTARDSDNDAERPAEPALSRAGGTLRVSLALLLIGAALIPPTWTVFVPLLLTLVLLPWVPGIAERVVGWVQRRGD